MLKIALCDDEINQRYELVNMLHRALIVSNTQYQIFEFESGEQLLASKEDFDIFFLDILMDKLTGIDVAKKIRLINEKTVIIFITALKDYVFDAFDVRAFHYILKPVNEKNLEKFYIWFYYNLKKRINLSLLKQLSSQLKFFLKI